MQVVFAGLVSPTLRLRFVSALNLSILHDTLNPQMINIVSTEGEYLEDMAWDCNLGYEHEY